MPAPTTLPISSSKYGKCHWSGRSTTPSIEMKKFDTIFAMIRSLACAYDGWTGPRPGSHRRQAASAAGVVGRLGGHLDVGRVALLEGGLRDPDEPATLLQLGDGAGADVEHRLAKPACELVCDGRQRATVGDPSFDALGNELVVGVDLGLEVAVLGVGLLAP